MTPERPTLMLPAGSMASAYGKCAAVGVMHDQAVLEIRDRNLAERGPKADAVLASAVRQSLAGSLGPSGQQIGRADGLCRGGTVGRANSIAGPIGFAITGSPNPPFR